MRPQLFKLSANHKRSLESSTLMSTMHSSRDYRCQHQNRLLEHSPPLFTRAIAGRWTTCWTSNRMSSRYPVVAHAIQALFLDCLASTTARSCCVPCVIVEFGRLTPSSDSHLRVFWHICWLHVLLVCTVIAAPLVALLTFPLSSIAKMSRDLVRVLFLEKDS